MHKAFTTLCFCVCLNSATEAFTPPSHSSPFASMPPSAFEDSLEIIFNFQACRLSQIGVKRNKCLGTFAMTI